MTTLRQRINQLRFALRCMYGVPESILDKIDVEAYADNKLEFKENLKVLEKAYPELREYIERNKDLETVAETTYEDFIEELKYLLTELAEGDEEAKRQMEMLGMNPSEAVDAILFYLEEQTKPVTVKKVVEKKVIKKESNLEKLKSFYRAYLEGLGIKNVEEEMKKAEGDIEALAEAVDKGRMSLKEAEERVKLLAPPPTVAPPITKEERKPRIIKAPEVIGGFPETIPQYARERLEEEMVNMPERVREEFKNIARPEVLRDIIIHGFETAKRINKVELYYGDDYYVKVLLSALFREVAKRFTAKSVSDYAASVILSKYNDIILDSGIGKAFQHIWASLYHRLPKKKLEIKRMKGKGMYSQAEIVYALTLWKVLNAFGLSIPEAFENERYILSKVGMYG